MNWYKRAQEKPSFNQIREKAEKHGLHHHLKLVCDKCGLVETCRCPAEKTEVHGICWDCEHGTPKDKRLEFLAQTYRTELADAKYPKAGPEVSGFKVGSEIPNQESVRDAAQRAGYNIGPVFHGSYWKFTVFDAGRSGQGSGDMGYFGKGLYFTPIEGLARYYGTNVSQVYLMIKNPYKTTGQKMMSKDLGTSKPSEVTEILRSRGYDAAIVENPNYPEAMQAEQAVPFVEVAVFEPNQIKLADDVTFDDTENPIPLEQRFDPSNPDIRY